MAPLFPNEAEEALEVFKSLRVVDVAGQPTFGDCSEQWVFDFVALIFGAYDAEHGERLISEFLLLISKKNGKSTLVAGIMLTALIRNWRLSAELLILAPSLEVAKNAWKPLVDMVRADPVLTDLLHIQENIRQVTNRRTGAQLKVVAADTEVVGGKKAGFVLVEELWQFGKRANAGSMLMEALGGLVSRPEGFVIYVTTASDDAPAGVFKEKLDLFRDIRDGKIIDQRKYGVLYEFPKALIEREAYFDPEFFYVTNPNLGRSVRKAWLVEKLEENRRGDKGTLNIFLAKHLNVEIGMGLRANRWPGAEYWPRAIDALLAEVYSRSPFDALVAMLKRCECAVAGIDGGGLDDLAGLCILGREPDEIEVEFEINGRMVRQKMKRWLAWYHAWCHAGVLERRQSIATNLREFEQAKELTIGGDELADVAAIVETVKMVKEAGLLAGVAVDPAGLGEIGEGLAEIEITAENKLLIGAPQGFGMMNAIKTSERRLAKGLLRHCGGKLMPWCVGNLKIEPTATAIRATKQNAGDAKIDPVMALFDAAFLMGTNPQPPKKPQFQMFVLR